jgi:putative addiction module killer protein
VSQDPHPVLSPTGRGEGFCFEATYKNIYNGEVADRSLVWLGASLDALRNFPADARRRAGYQLRRVQQGLEPTDWKPMKSIGAGVAEIRIHTGLEHRVFYVSKFAEVVLVLHAFQKRTRRTPASDINLARQRLDDFLLTRRKRKET